MTAEPTPRTDALYVSPLDSNDVYAWQTLARQLERELALAQSRLAEVEKELAQWKARAKGF